MTVNGNGTTEPIEQIDLLKQNFIDTWTYLSHAVFRKRIIDHQNIYTQGWNMPRESL